MSRSVPLNGGRGSASSAEGRQATGRWLAASAVRLRRFRTLGPRSLSERLGDVAALPGAQTGPRGLASDGRFQTCHTPAAGLRLRQQDQERGPGSAGCSTVLWAHDALSETLYKTNLDFMFLFNLVKTL